MNQWKKLTTFYLPLYRQDPKVNKASLQWKKLTLRKADGDPTFELDASVFFHMATTDASHGVVMLVQESHYGHKVSTTIILRGRVRRYTCFKLVVGVRWLGSKYKSLKHIRNNNFLYKKYFQTLDPVFVDCKCQEVINIEQ